MNGGARGALGPYTGGVSVAMIFSLVGVTILGVAIDHWLVNRPR